MYIQCVCILHICTYIYIYWNDIEKLMTSIVSRFQVWMGAPALVCQCSGRLLWGACYGLQRHQCQSCAIMPTTWLHYVHSHTFRYMMIRSLYHPTSVLLYIDSLDLLEPGVWGRCFMSCVSVIGCTSSASDFPSPSSAISALVQERNRWLQYQGWVQALR